MLEATTIGTNNEVVTDKTTATEKSDLLKENHVPEKTVTKDKVGVKAVDVQAHSVPYAGCKKFFEELAEVKVIIEGLESLIKSSISLLAKVKARKNGSSLCKG